MELLCVGREFIDKELFCNVKNQPIFNKPIGGLWSSPYRKDDKYKSDWLEWCSCVGFGRNLNIGVVFELKDDARILTIDSYQDLKEATLKYEAMQEIDFLNRKYLDFEKISQDYDAIYLTQKGEQETRLTFEYSLYGWDVETVLILNYNSIKKESIRKISID